MKKIKLPPYFIYAIRSSLHVLKLIVSLPIVLLVTIVRPWVRIRFGTLRSERIGHFAAETEAYVRELQRLSPAWRTIDIIWCPQPVCNRQLEAMWRRTFAIAPFSRAAALLDLESSIRFWAGAHKHSVNVRDRSEDYRYFTDTKPNLSFTANEEARGRQGLRELGLPDDAEWVCIHNRDSAYLETVFNKSFSYHDYRDYEIESMLAAAEELAARGYYVIRVGSITKNRLHSENSRVIDYANSPHRSEFLDIYLLAHARFFLGNDSGIWCVPLVFRRPLAMTNLVAFANFYKKDYGPWFFIPKKMRDPCTGRLLSLRELLSAGYGDAWSTDFFSAAGVKLENNSSEEICELAVELDEWSKGIRKPEVDDEELQKQFWAIFVEHARGSDIPNRRARIGARFLRRHPEFLK